MSRDVRDMGISDSMFEWTIASVSALVHVETDEEQTGEAIQDNIPPKTIGLIGATHDPVARLESFPTQYEDRWHHQQHDPNQQQTVLAIDEIGEMVHCRQQPSPLTSNSGYYSHPATRLSVPRNGDSYAFASDQYIPAVSLHAVCASL